MLKKLKRQITIVISLFMALLIIAVLVFVNVFFITQTSNDIYSNLEVVMTKMNYGRIESQLLPIWEYHRQHGTKTAPVETVPNLPLGSETFGHFSAVFVTRYYIYVLYNDNDFGLSDEELVNYAENVVDLTDRTPSRGHKNGFFYSSQYFDNGRLLLVTGDENIMTRSAQLTRTSMLVGCFGIIIAVWIASAVADRLTQPVAETIKNERAFVNDVSHELKTPLAVITSNAEALETEITSNKWLTCIKSESTRMAGLINDMLAFSRIEKNNDRSSFTKTDFSACVEEIVMNFEAPAFEKGVLINTEIQPDVTVFGSAERLKQVVAILVDNAVKYVQEDGSINVLLKSRRGNAVLTVENTGSFIEKDDQKRIFERFYRADVSRSNTQEGQNEASGLKNKPRSYGLGLAIAKRIVEFHEGNISVFSSKEENKTVFKVVI